MQKNKKDKYSYNKASKPPAVQARCGTSSCYVDARTGVLKRLNMKKKLILLGVMIMGLFSCSFQKTDEEKFWNWFCKNSQMIYDFESNQEVIFDKIQEQLHKINSNLTFEISSVKNHSCLK